MITRLVSVALYAPTADSHGAPVDDWAPEQAVAVFGWAPASSDQPIEGNRRPVIVDLVVFSPEMAGGPRARWSLPGEAALEQVGHGEDFRNGPWWATSGVRINLRRVEG